MMKNMIYSPQKVCTEENYIEMYADVCKTNETHIENIEKQAIANGGLLHRFLYESVADGKAVYQIVKVNKTTVRVKLCSIDGLYDDYVVPQWGKEATIPMSYAENSIRYQDAWREAVNKKKSENIS